MKKLEINRKPYLYKDPDRVKMESDQERLINSDPKYKKLLNDVKNKPFWCHNPKSTERHKCCFNHIIGLPVKNGKEHPIYDYEEKIIQDLEENQHLWIKKARGIGATELMLRYLAWQCLSTTELAGKSIFIISGTREDFANNLKIRLEELFERKYAGIDFHSKYTELVLNRTWLKIFPTKALKSLRGYTDVSYIFIDEADFFELSEQKELGYVIKSYEEKSNAKIIMASTPNRPDGLYAQIEAGETFKDFFKLVLLPYTLGLGKIFDQAFIDRERKQRSAEFDREYGLMYLGRIGNVFTADQIDLAIFKGKQLLERNPTLTPSRYYAHYVGVDYGGGSSKTAYCMVEHDYKNNMLYVLDNDEYPRSWTPSMIADHLFNISLKMKQNYLYMCDGARPDSINELKIRFDEPTTWEKPGDISPTEANVYPVNFRQEHKIMLEWSHSLISQGQVAIPAKFDKLIIALRTAWAKEWDLDKKESVNNDHLDALRLALRGVHQEVMLQN